MLMQQQTFFAPSFVYWISRPIEICASSEEDESHAGYDGDESHESEEKNELVIGTILEAKSQIQLWLLYRMHR